MIDATLQNPLSSFLAAGTGAIVNPVDRILDAVRLHLGMDIAFASRIADGRRQFTHISADGPVPASPGDSEPLEETFCHRILEGRLPELIHDASLLEEAADIPITRALPVGSHLNVPLRMKDGSLYGTFCCLSRTPDLSLTERDLSTLRAFAALAAGQIEQELDDEREREQSRARIVAAIAQDRLTIHYQPIHGLADGRPVGVECLARFPDCASRSPSDWFDEAAAAGLGVELEMLAVREALRGLPYIPADLYVAVNVSPATVLAGGLEALLADAPPGRLVLEVTEHSKVADYIGLRDALNALRTRARIAIDDVGAGYSGLRHILDLRPDILKLDMSLTRDIDSDGARRALALAMVAFAKGIDSKIVAEGVETESEMRTLRDLGVGHAQGYHFSRPMPAVAAQQFLLGGRWDAPEDGSAHEPLVAKPRFAKGR